MFMNTLNSFQCEGLVTAGRPQGVLVPLDRQQVRPQGVVFLVDWLQEGHEGLLYLVDWQVGRPRRDSFLVNMAQVRSQGAKS